MESFEHCRCAEYCRTAYADSSVFPTGTGHAAPCVAGHIGDTSKLRLTPMAVRHAQCLRAQHPSAATGVAKAAVR